MLSVYIALALVAVSLVLMFVALRGTENTFQLIAAIAHVVAAATVGQYLIWPGQAYATAVTFGVMALAAVSVAVFTYLAAKRS